MINKLLKLFQITTIFSVISFIVFSSFIFVEAKTVDSPIVSLWLYSSLSDSPGNFGQGYRILDISAGVEYNSKIKLDTGVITNGTVLLKGTKFEIINDLGEIFWFGAGEALGTPYGEWYSGQLPPLATYNPKSCNDPLAKGEEAIVECFSVNPPIIKNDFTGTTAGYSCDPSVTNITGGTSQVCTILSPGDINVSVKFESTRGNLYSVYPVLERGSGQIDIATIRQFFPTLKYLSAEKDSGAIPLEPPVTGPYYFPFPEANFNFNFSAKDPPLTNNPPTISITHNPPALTFFTGDQVTFNFTGDDADPGDRLTYQIDWTDNSVHVANNVLPTPSGDVAPQTTLSDQKSWAMPGTKRIWARAVDSKGVFSNWEYDEVTVDAPPPPPATPTITLTDSGCSGTQPYIKLDWATSLGATKYYIDRNAFEIGSTNGLLTYQDSIVTNSTLYSYSVRAEGPTGTSGSSASVSVTALNCAPPPPVCGNGNIEEIEQCDGTNFGADSCQARGFSQGSLSCGLSSSPSPCIINSSDCRNPAPATASSCGNGKCEKTLKENFNNCPKDCPSNFKETMAPRVNFLAWVGNFFSFWFK